MADILEDTQKEIRRRLEELEPLIGEYNRLLAASEALAGVLGEPQPPRGRRGRPKRVGTTRAAKPMTAKTRKRGASRPRSGTGRGAEALALVQGQPGIAIPELAETMGIKQNYLYRVMPRLQKAGNVRKRGRGWHPNP